MLEESSKPEEIEEEVDKQEVASASYVIQSLIKASKASRMYLPNNPLHKKFMLQFHETMSKHLDEYDDLKLDIDQFEIKYRQNSIYKNEDSKNSLAFKFNSDGVRSLTFEEGIDESEIVDFLSIMGQERTYEADDDIVTQLWEKNFSHIHYVVTEDSDETSGTEIGTSHRSEEEQGESIQNAQKEIAPEAPVPIPMNIPQNILGLSKDEIGWLKEMRSLEEKREPIDDVVTILTTVITAEKNVPIFEDFVGVTLRLIEDLIHSGEAQYSLDLLKFLLNLGNDEKIDAVRREILVKARSGVLSKSMIEGLGKIIDETDIITQEQLRSLILLIGRDAIRPISTLLGTAEKRETRKVIIDALVKIGKNDPKEFFPCLHDSRWYFVRNAVLILRLIGSPISLKPVSQHINHADSRVRKEVLFYLQTICDDASKNLIIKFLNDAESNLRIRAIKSLVKLKYVKALKPAIAITEGKNFEEWEISERKIFFESIGELGQNDALPLLGEMLEKKFWLNKEKEKDFVTCAVAGFRKIKTAASLKLLQEAKEQKKGDILEIVEHAIKALSGKK